MARHLVDRQLTSAGDVNAQSAGAGIAVATAGDGAELRALLRRIETPGGVRLAFTREPDYFAGEGLAGAVDHTLVFRDHGRISGMARLSEHALCRNGTECRVGYLGELRLAPEARRRARMLRDGFDVLRQMVVDREINGCFTSIALDNERARKVLENGRRLGLPSYTPVADLVTLVAPTMRRTRAVGAEHDKATLDREELTAFLTEHASAAHLTPAWNSARWDALERHGVHARDFCVVRDEGRIVAVALLWDQRDFKQTVICGYRGALRVVRPLSNVLARVGLTPPMPPAGHVLELASVFGATVASDQYWPALWNQLNAAATERAIDWLVIARETRDRQLAALRRLVRGREYHTRLYDVRWRGVPTWSTAWNAQPFRPEVALL